MEEKAVIAIDLGGTRIKLGLVRAGNVLMTSQMDSQSGQGLQARLPQLETAINMMLAEARLTTADLIGVGIAIPGIVDPINKRVLTINGKYSDAPELDLPAWASKTWGLPLYLENDTRAALLGEWQYGSGKGYDNVIHPGTNGKMPEINAAMGLVNLESLTGFVEANRQRHEAYRQAFRGIAGIGLVAYDEHCDPNYHYAIVEVNEGFRAGRDEVVAALQAENILARKYFWPGCHRMQPYRDLFPHAGLLLAGTEDVARRVMVLPNGPSLGQDVVPTIAAVFDVLSTP
ncbi:MAG: ROK family protein [Oxalobacteraceae bacterium]|nr:MAG: ROK family protein [Oxalobacteraceae bacterium]